MSKENLVKILGSLSKESSRLFLTNLYVLCAQRNLNLYDYVQPSKFGTVLAVSSLPDDLLSEIFDWFVATKDVHLVSCRE